MIRHTIPLLVVLLLASASSGAEPLTKAEIAKRGKAATALVHIKARRAFGTAFCIHSSGLFVTNQHVVNGQSTITLVLHPGQENQKVVQAKVIRGDKALDLALVRVEGAKDYPTVPIGSDAGLTELMQVVVLGFPFGSALSVTKGNYPAISINVSNITSLRRRSRKLHRIQLDSGLNPGHSGGPVMGPKGDVVGIVVSGVQGAGINFAIPVSHLRKFITRPNIELVTPSLSASTMHKPVTFQAKVTSFLPDAPPLQLELTLTADGKAQKHKMRLNKGAYEVEAIPVRSTNELRRIRLTTTYQKGSVTGMVVDQAIQVGERKLMLSDVQSIIPGDKPRVRLTTGSTVEGKLTNLDRVPLDLGQTNLTLNLTLADQVQLRPIATVSSVKCTLVVSNGKEEIERISRAIPIRDGAREVPATDVRVGITPPKLSEGQRTLTLSSTVTDVVVGGGGRYLILHLPKERKLAIFDATQAKIVKTIVVGDDSVRFTAGRDALMLYLPSSGILQRWSLTTFKREISVPMPVQSDADATFAMGSDSNGPLLANGQFLDVVSLKPIPLKLPVNARGEAGPKNGAVRVSADGTTFANWRTSGSPSGVRIDCVHNFVLRRSYAHTTGGSLVPSSNGKVIFSSKEGLWSPEAKKVTKSVKDGRKGCIPAVHGRFYLAVRQLSAHGAGPGLSVYVMGDDRPLLQIPNVKFTGKELDPWGRSKLTLDKRIHFIPDANLLVRLSETDDSLLIRKLDVEQTLKQTDVNYFVVASEPPTKAIVGRKLTYQMKVLSKIGKLQYRVESGPLNMTVSPDGLVSWPVQQQGNAENVPVIIVVKDGNGQELFHRFDITVER